MRWTKHFILTLFLVGCAGPEVTINIPPDHPASPNGREAAYAPTPTPITTNSTPKAEATEETKGRGGMLMGEGSHMRCGGSK